MDFIDRMKDECSELEERISKLKAFIETREFAGLHKKDAKMLREQLLYMNGYRNVLNARIVRSSFFAVE